MATVATWTYKEHMTASTPRNARTPVLYRDERVPGLFERTLGDGSKVYECKTRAGGKIVSKRLTTEHGKVGEARREVEAIRSGAAPITPGRLTLDALAEQCFESQDAEAARGTRSCGAWRRPSSATGRTSRRYSAAGRRQRWSRRPAAAAGHHAWKELAGNTAPACLNTLSPPSLVRRGVEAGRAQPRA